MRKEKTMSFSCKLFLAAILVVLTAIGCAMTASADDLVWNLLTDSEAGYRVEDKHGSYTMLEEEDGTPYMVNSKKGAVYIYDDNNILGTYRTFSLEGDFYFESFPQGLRDGETPEQSPLSFLCWIYKNASTGKRTRFNAIRIDSQGYIHTSGDGAGKTDIQLETGRWYNIRCVFTPLSGVSEMFLDGEKVLDFNIVRFDSELYTSGAVRYFDGYFDNWIVKMKNLMVKTDSEYTIELKREDAADYVGHQVTKPEGNTFSLRTILGVDDTAYNRIGYEVIVLDMDDEGNILSETVSKRSKVVYETLRDANGNTYNVKESFGYNYAAALEVSDLPVMPTGICLEVVIRPYVLGMDGIRRYGTSVVLSYNGKLDDEGYPIVEKKDGNTISIVASDDTCIWNSGGNVLADFSTARTLDVWNPGDVNSNKYMAAYYKFTLDADAVKALETAVSAKIRVYILDTTESETSKIYDLMLYATGTDWTERSLNYKTHTKLAPTQELVYKGAFDDNGYFSIDILSYLTEQPVAEDGTLTVSFCFSNEGHADAAQLGLRSKESGYMPTIEIENSMYHLELNISKISNIGYEPWGYAEMLVDEWFDELVDKIYPKDENGNVIYYDELGAFDPEGYSADSATGDFTKEVAWTKYETIWTTDAANGYMITEDQWETQRFARTLSTLGTSAANAFLESAYAEQVSEYDIYGGVANAGFKGEATGFFHTETIGGRTYIIDPLGNPYFAVGMNDVTTGSTANQRNYSLETYGTKENYFAEITDSLKDMGVNTAFVSDESSLLKIENGLATVVALPGVNSYMTSIGRQQVRESLYPFNNTLNVFDPDFVKSTNTIIAETITTAGYADNPYVFGYTADNELASGPDILERYLTLDPNEDAGNAFSYATVWTWLARRLNTPVPTLEDVQRSPDRAQLNSEFLAFVYARNYSVIREAIEAVDQNHMYLGSRVNGICLTNEGYHRAAGYYLDIITVNLYDGLNPTSTTISNIYRNSGKPFIVTEFFAKGMDAIDANGFKLANSTGAGILVGTQQERGEYYEHYILALLESKACVGWTWYRFRDNDQSLWSTGSNTLIMLNVTYGELPKGNTFMDETGKILPASDIGGIYYEIYTGDAIASNQNVNKGVYNSDFSSTVTVYTYDKNGKLIESMGYEVETPESENPADGTVLKAIKDGTAYTIGSVTGADGSVTKTILTTYKGKYLALSNSIRAISDHIIGIVNYLDADCND